MKTAGTAFRKTPLPLIPWISLNNFRQPHPRIFEREFHVPSRLPGVPPVLQPAEDIADIEPPRIELPYHRVLPSRSGPKRGHRAGPSQNTPMRPSDRTSCASRQGKPALPFFLSAVPPSVPVGIFLKGAQPPTWRRCGPPAKSEDLSRGTRTCRPLDPVVLRKASSPISASSALSFIAALRIGPKSPPSRSRSKISWSG